MTKQIATTAPPSTSELYPIAEDAEVTKHIFRRTRKDRDENGTMIIPSALTMIEREMISKRLHAIAPHLKPATMGQIKKAVAEMLVGFGAIRAAADAEAAAVIAKFAEAMQDLPIYAIRRACLRFSRGEVRKDEVGAKKDLDVGSPPTTAQLRMVAEAIARPDRDEATIASMLLRAKVTEERDLSDEEVAKRREHAERVRKEFAEQVKAQSGETEFERDERERREHRHMSRQRQDLIAEYEEQGLEPQFADDSRETVVSLAMMLRNGWLIERVDGRSVLMRGDEVR